MLTLIALVAVYRLFSKDYAPEPDRSGLLQFLGILVSASACHQYWHNKRLNRTLFCLVEVTCVL